jgi:transcriptional regulator with XRE-family HTH domain
MTTDYGGTVLERRLAMGLSQTRLAVLSGVTDSTIGAIERGKKPTDEQRRLLEAALTDTSSPPPSSAPGVGPAAAPEGGEDLAPTPEEYALGVSLGLHWCPGATPYWEDPSTGAGRVWRDGLVWVAWEAAGTHATMLGALRARANAIRGPAVTMTVDVPAAVRELTAQRDEARRSLEASRQTVAVLQGERDRLQKERDEVRAGWNAWVEGARADLGASAGEDFADACRRLRRERDEACGQLEAVDAALGVGAPGRDRPTDRAAAIACLCALVRDLQDGEGPRRDALRAAEDALASANLPGDHAAQPLAERVRALVESVHVLTGFLGAVRVALGASGPLTAAEMVVRARDLTSLAGSLELELAAIELADALQAVKDIEWVYHGVAEALKAAGVPVGAFSTQVRMLVDQRDRLQERVAELERLRDDGPALTVEEIGRCCGLARSTKSGFWLTPNNIHAVWKGEIGWNWNAGDGLHGLEMREEAALRAYAAAKGVSLGAPAPQPAPSGGTGDCWADLIAYLPDHPLRPEMEARRAKGIATYGVPLGRGDGRDADRDLLEELLDAAVYAERLHLRDLAVQLLDIARGPAEYLAEEEAYLDQEEETAAAVAEALARAGVPSGPLPDRVRELAERATWTARERRTLEALLDALEEADASMAIALRGLCGVEVACG